MDNPYNAPAADLTAPLDNAATRIPRFFAWKGRLGRARYIAYSGGAMLLAMVLASVIMILLMILAGSKYQVAVFLPLINLVAMLAGWSIVAVRRLNDMNRTGWLALLFAVPLVNLALGLWLLFGPGNRQANKYGAPPSRNSTWVYATCLVLVLGALISVLTAYGVHKASQLGISGNSPTFIDR